MKNIIATLIILHNIKSLLRLQRRYTLSIFLSEILGKVLRSDIKSLLRLQRRYTLSIFLSEILGKVLRSDIKSLLTPAHSPNGIIPLFESQRE